MFTEDLTSNQAFTKVLFFFLDNLIQVIFLSSLVSSLVSLNLVKKKMGIRATSNIKLEFLEFNPSSELN